MNEGTGASEEAAAQVSEFQAAISGVQEKINALVESYNEAYSAAYESISGQYQLWDEAAKVVATSAGSINSALESQITYWQDYNANLQSLTDRSADIEGLSDMIASFADGSSDSVNAIAGMAGATDEQLATMVANWKTLQQEQQNAAGSVADLKTDFTATMDELQTALAEDIEAMDLGDEAKAKRAGHHSGLYRRSCRYAAPSDRRLQPRRPPQPERAAPHPAPERLGAFPATQLVRSPPHPALPSSAKTARSWSTSTAASRS